MYLNSIDASFLSQYLKDKKKVFISFITNEYIDMALNWFEWNKKCGIDGKALICCLDEKAYETLQQKNVPSVHTDQDAIYNSLENKTYGSFYKLPRHVCILYVLDNLITNYNVDIMYTDIDMVIIKSPCDKIYKEIADFDTCIYTNKTYNEITNGVKYGSSVTDSGGMVLVWNKKTVSRFINTIKTVTHVNADSPKSGGVGSLAELFDLKVKMLNAFEFTNIDIWKQDHMRKVIKNRTYIIHYNMFDDVTKLSSNKLKMMINKKIQAMKDYDHWII